MESNDIIESLSLKFEEIEHNKNYDDRKSVLWVQEITEPEFQLMDRLVNILTSPLTTNKTKATGFLIVKLCLQMSPSVCDQVKASDSLPKVLVQYIIDTKGANFDKNSIYILSKVFMIEKYQPFFSYEFISAIFSSLDKLDDEELFENLILILIDINATYTSHEENKFLPAYHDAENKRLLEEVVLRLLNVETDKEKILQIYLTLMDIMDYEKKNVFYSKDMEAFIDISLMKLESNYSEEIKLFALETLKRVTFYDDYYKDMYKIQALTDLMEDYKQNENNSKPVRDICEKILNNLVKNLQKKLGGGVGDEEEEEGEDEEEEGEEEEEQKEQKE